MVSPPPSKSFANPAPYLRARKLKKPNYLEDYRLVEDTYYGLLYILGVPGEDYLRAMSGDAIVEGLQDYMTKTLLAIDKYNKKSPGS